MYRLALLISFIGTLLHTAYAQQPTAAPSTMPLFYEKVYLHTDRDTYAPGEDIWFKAYLLNAQTNEPIGHSKSLYVELIDPMLKVPYHLVLRMEEGLGHGDIKLQDTVPPGNYRLRAYTNWMRNFGDRFVFEKRITIVKTPRLTNIADVAKVKVAKAKGRTLVAPQQAATDTPTVQFFPRRGSLVAGLPSVIAVKAEDAGGRGIAVSGTILNTAGTSIARFKCDSLGMSSFTFTPDETQQYRALVIINNVKQIFSLPPVQGKGFTLSMSALNKAITAVISCNAVTLNSYTDGSLTLMGRHLDKTYYRKMVAVNAGRIVVELPDDSLPHGITCFTLYDEQARPLCERLIYVNHPPKVQLSISTDKAVYAPREPVTVKLGGVRLASLSLAAVDAGVVPVEEENIASYLNLRSEIGGNIEHPGRYFDTTNVNRLAQLDMLLLTQGWREYVWKNAQEPPAKLTYEAEQGITLSGRVRGVYANKPQSRMSITMFANKAVEQKLFSAVTDSMGRFTISGLHIYGYQFVNFTSRRPNGKSGGFIQVDSLLPVKMPVGPNKLVLSDTALIQPLLVEREITKQKFTLNGINQLNAVTVKGYTSALPPEVHNITTAEHKEYGNLMQYLIQLIPGGAIGGDVGCLYLISGYVFPGAHEVRVAVSAKYTDGSFAKIDCVDTPYPLSMDRVLKVTVQPYQTIDGMRYRVDLLLRPGSMEKTNYFDNTLADINGYYQARKFYAPNHSKPDAQPDYRTTLHWQPNITTNMNGAATLTYYNADPQTKVRIIVQGITDNGVPIVATTKYEVK